MPVLIEWPFYVGHNKSHDRIEKLLFLKLFFGAVWFGFLLFQVKDVKV